MTRCGSTSDPSSEAVASVNSIDCIRRIPRSLGNFSFILGAWLWEDTRAWIGRLAVLESGRDKMRKRIRSIK